jgi:hypothetical protein
MSPFNQIEHSNRIFLLSFIASLCLVSRIWLTPSRRLLYHTIPDLTCTFMMTPNRFPKFARTVRDLPAIRSYVRWMYVVGDNKTWPDWPTEIIKYLPLCSFIVPNPRWDPTSAIAAQPSFRAITNTSFTSGTSDAWLTAFPHWQRLERLEILDSKCIHLSKAQQNDVAMLPSLKLLALRSQNGHLAIPPTHPNTLHTIEITNAYNIEDTEPLLALLRRHSRSLRSLHIECLHFLNSHLCLDGAVGTAENLEALLIRHTPHVSAGVLSNLPPTIVHVSLNCSSSSESLQTSIDFLRHGDNANLKISTTDLTFTNPSPLLNQVTEEWTTIVRKLAKKFGINLTLNDAGPSYSKEFNKEAESGLDWWGAVGN